MQFQDFPNRPLNGGIQYVAKFQNGYGASIVQHDFSYGGRNGEWELAVIKHNDLVSPFKFDDLCYDTPITSDVLGYLSEEEVNENLLKIQAL